ncbi:Site-specific DNA recombinase [Glycomyces sambucus]|uniref:Site-specific DNA recombinase n=1 Tax=Glycomyces sambucus TaxID=380244 RepID=A0A1G9LVY5_9ACTN|nr:Site-specific DNA recombinase [Glycomyces sambucus]
MNAEPVDGAKSGGRAVVYLRVSSQGQVDTDYDPEGNSIPAQRKACERKAQELGFEIVEEYVDPGRSGMEVKNRPAFQEMMARIRNQKDIDCVIVYARSRIHRNATDAGLTRRELKQLGVSLVSVRDFTDDSEVGDMVGTILDAVNEYQSRASGADIAYKMEAKAKRGGTPGRAKLGYINMIEEVDGRNIRTVKTDPERRSFIPLIFEMFATGEYSTPQLRDAVTRLGLRSRPTKQHPAGRPISNHKIDQVLRDRYYLGHVTYKGREYPGRHVALVSQVVFDRVQALLETRTGAGTRQRVYDHPLKSGLSCGRCGGRIYLDRGKNQRGVVYFYFICLGIRDRSCDLPRLRAEQVDVAVADHFTTLQLGKSFITATRSAIEAGMKDAAKLGQQMRRKLRKERARIAEQRSQLLDLVGNWPQDLLDAKMSDLSDQLVRIDGELESTDSAPVIEAGKAVNTLLELLDDPRGLYRSLTDKGKRRFVQACFAKLYVNADEHTEAPFIERDELRPPFTPLLGGYEKRQRRESPLASTSSSKATCSNGDPLVELRGFEPLTFSMPWKRATNCAKAP